MARSRRCRRSKTCTPITSSTVWLLPARLPVAVTDAAVALATEIARALCVEGLLTVEFFFAAGTTAGIPVGGGSLFVNELAPRPHNSGHVTRAATTLSQFDLLARVLCGLPLGRGDRCCRAAGAWGSCSAICGRPTDQSTCDPCVTSPRWSISICMANATHARGAKWATSPSAVPTPTKRSGSRAGFGGRLPSADATLGYQARARATLRAYLRELERRGVFAHVRARVSASTRALFDDPPPASSWIDAAPIEDLMGVVSEQSGEGEVRALSRDAQKSLVPLLRPLIEGALRLFGTSPPTLYTRLDLLTKTSLRGVSFSWVARGAHEGDVVVRFVDRRQVPGHVFVSFASSLELVLELCGKQGTVSAPVMANGQSARFAVAWKS